MDEAAFFLWRQEPEWCRAHRLGTLTAVAKAAVSFAALRLGWDSLAREDRGLAALSFTSFHDVVGAVRFGRLIDGVRQFVRRATILRMAPAVLAALRRRPGAREAAHAYLADARASPPQPAGSGGSLGQAPEVKRVRWQGSSVSGACVVEKCFRMMRQLPSMTTHA